MSRPKAPPAKKPASQPPKAEPGTFAIHWKSIGIGVIAGILIFWLLVYVLGARLEEIGIGPVKFSLPAQPAGGGQSAAAGLPYESTLLSLSYIAGGWDPHVIDLRSAAEDGIPVWPGEGLSFTDLWVTSPASPAGLQAQVKFYRNDTGDGNCIGETPRVPLEPGKTLIKEITLLKLTPDDRNWTVGEDWERILAVTTLFEDGKEMSASVAQIRINRNGSAWLNPYSDAKFAEIAAQVDGGPPFQVDLRRAPVDGLSLPSGAQLCVQEIWYRSRNAAKNNQIAVEATLGEFSEETYRNSAPAPFTRGVNPLQDFTPLCWELPAQDTFLTITLYQAGGAVMDFIYVPITISAR